MSRPLASLLSRPTNPAILPIAPRTTGNNVPKSLHKTRRTWRPNVTRADWTTSLLPSDGSAESSAMGLLRGVKMQMRRVRDVEKAGGIEGLLVSRPAKDLTPFGRRLRSALFTELHRLKDEIISEKGGATAVDGTTEDTTPAGQLPSPGTAEELLREA